MVDYTVPLMCLFSLLAGFVDAVVGGGGLIQLPAILILMPGVPFPTLLGTNKFASMFGTSMAVYRYTRASAVDWSTVVPATVAAFVCAFLGSLAVSLLNPAVLRPLILVLLIAVAIYVFFVKELGLIHQPKHAPRKARWLGILIGAALGFYDGFFGPGTGSFLIFGFVAIFGFDFLSASASAKVVNLATNVASVIYFAATDQLLYGLGLAMALCSVIGATLGSHLAIAKGSKFVRVFFLVIVVALIAKLAQTMWSGS
ncbi:MAG: Transmembrane protein YfcA [uncultured Chthoniobacterales bacterium]|uniref:Probable membrane transporter protein n=1 Tax=uncultured Chthoniobacterales bacterium TaxID=1836801 RepID=A0A6J4IWD8_9BACT|nr:MAG: Transmembrane protein YfcA [uncultured Chthoniobacterales bacterium]